MNVRETAGILRTAENLILTTHTSPDADGLGAEYALVRSLSARGRQTAVLNADPVPESLFFLDPEGFLSRYRRPEELPSRISDALLLVIDTNDIDHTGFVADYLVPRVRDVLIIDHHESEHRELCEGNLIDSDASSTCEVVFDLLEALDLSPDEAAARALYAGILFDTGSFAYPKTRPRTFEVARDLVERGVVPFEIYSRLYQSASLSALRLEARILAGLRFFEEERVAVLVMTREDLRASGAAFEETGGVVNHPLRAERVRVSVFFKERQDGELRCSLRSKGEVNVAHVAKAFGGGGHATAAGFTCRDTIDRSREKVLEIIRRHFVNLH